MLANLRMDGRFQLGSSSLGAAEGEYMESREGNWVSTSGDLPRNNLVHEKLHEVFAVKISTGPLPILTEYSSQPISMWIEDRPQAAPDLGNSFLPRCRGRLGRCCKFVT